MTEYNLDQPEDRVVDDVIGRLETYLFTQGVSVELGVNGRRIIEDLVFQYGVEATKSYDEIGRLSIKLQELQAEKNAVLDALDKVGIWTGADLELVDRVTFALDRLEAFRVELHRDSIYGK